MKTTTKKANYPADNSDLPYYVMPGGRLIKYADLTLEEIRTAYRRHSERIDAEKQELNRLVAEVLRRTP
jgi:hypothetical protein